MYRWIFLGAVLIGFSACQGGKKQEAQQEDRLSTDLVNIVHTPNGVDSAAIQSLPDMQFSDTAFNFGTVKEGAEVNHGFLFTNIGKGPLVISSATGSCGCTVAEYPRQPMAPGERDTIHVKFSSKGKSGIQEKTVSLRTNTLRGTYTLSIKGTVEESK
jgi:hypothetical protein